MNISRDLSPNNVIFEQDYLRVINEVNLVKVNETTLSMVVQDIKCMLEYNPIWIVNFVHREANMVAHILAKLACSTIGEKIWVEECPLNVMSFVLREKLYTLNLDE